MSLVAAPSAATAAAPPVRGPRVLFVAEAVTLAHVARPATLAGALHRAGCDVHLASDHRFDRLFPDLALPRHSLNSIPTRQFVAALRRGSPIYDLPTLERYVQDDLRIIEAVQPDVIVGDFRLSLCVSAKLARVPHIALANAYWSPFAKVKYPVPDHFVSRWFGRTIGQWLFSMGRPFVFARYAAPVNALRRRHGLPAIPGGLPGVYTHGDFTAYADVPSLVPMTLPANHFFLGPVFWSPPVPLPAWWNDVPTDRPIVYVNLGSSGDAKLLPRILESLSKLDVTVLAATAGASDLPPLPRATGAASRRFIADYLPGDAACAKADLVICNGGSLATQQALWHGKPVIGVPSNLDQCLNMQALVSNGAASAAFASRSLPASISRLVGRALENADSRQHVTRLCQELAELDSCQRLNALIHGECTMSPRYLSSLAAA